MRRSWSDRIAMTAVFCANGLAFGALAGNIPRLRDLGNLSPRQLGLALLAMSVGATLTMPVSARLAPRHGAATLAIAGGVGVGLLVALPALVLQAHVLQVRGGWVALLASFLVLGMASGVMDVAMNARGSEIERGWGAAVMSSFHAGWSVGGLTGSAIAAGFAAADASVAAALAAAGGLSIVAALSAWRLRRGEERLAAPPRPLRLTLPSRAMAGLCAITCLCFSMEGAMADWTGVYLREMLGASAVVASGAYSGFALAMAAARLGGDAVVRRLGRMRVLRGGGVIAAAAIGAGLLMGRPLAAAAAFALTGLGLANVVPVAFSVAGRRAGAGGIGMVASTGYLGLMAGPPVLGFAAQATTLSATMAYVLAGALAIVLLSRAAA